MMLIPNSPSPPPVWTRLADPVTGICGGRNLDLNSLLLAAHPDDETIGASACMCRLRNCAVVFLTDGAPRDPALRSPRATGSRARYARTRHDEAVAALALAGVTPDRILFLGGVDQEAIHETPILAERFASLLPQIQPDIIITHAYEGGHPDHDAAALVAALCRKMLQQEKKTVPEVLEMTSYHLRDGQCVTGEFLPQDWGQGSGKEEITLQLSPEERDRKEQMLSAYASQQVVLAGFSLGPERLRPAPVYDFTIPPHPGKLWYESLGWPMTGKRWREIAATALADLAGNPCV
jgi:LmbE family N-acetylglucosaminyl deacetylase